MDCRLQVRSRAGPKEGAVMRLTGGRFVLAAAALALSLTPALADNAKPIDVHYKDVPLRQAVAELAGKAGVECKVDPAVPDVPVSLSLLQVPPLSALRALAKSASSRVPGLAAVPEGAGMVVRVVPLEQRGRETLNGDLA